MKEMTARLGLDKLEEYSVETVPDADIVVNANESNWNLPKEVLTQILEETKKFLFNRYPPLDTGKLGRVLGNDLHVEQEQIIIGNGSSELLEKACFAFGGMGSKIAFPYPSFSMYGVYVQMADSIGAPYTLTQDGYIDPEAVIDFCQRENPSLLIVCNPNNPTGGLVSICYIE